MIPDHMTRNSSVSSLESLVGQILKAKSGSVIGGGLFGITYPEGDMI